ncbi:MAG: dipeptidase [Candidatus Tectomicrobia bacterium]|nr:dipeptidase [Candidatus Tectomicrobia bacterium]
MVEPTKAIAFARSNHDRYLLEFKEFLAIPSISTLSEHKPDIQRAAEWVSAQMRNMGLQNVEIMPTAGHPVVYGEWSGAPGKPTVLIYGHYDVQPVDPLNEWISPPFEPTIRGENIYARGASDMKGQDHAFLKALEALLANGELQVNVKVIMEGEEEIGSPNLEVFVEIHKDKLKCDLALNADSGILRPDLPSIVYGLRGIAYFEVWVYGPDHDLHSGIFGGSVHNPAQVLCELIAGMHDKDGHVTLPGFYDKVLVRSDEERAELARIPHSDEEWRRITGVPQLYGEKGFTTIERLGARPTLEVNGFLSGFTGEGSKTVLPAKAMAKISMRLVPYQDDKAIEEQLKEYLRQNALPTVRWEVKNLASSPAVLVKRDTDGVRAAMAALEATFGVKPVFKLEGGSVPVVSMVQAQLGVDSILMGFGLPDDNLHSPNEKLHLPTYYRGIEAYIRFFSAVAQGAAS